MSLQDAVERKPDLLEIDPRPCEHCGLTIDRHDMIDSGEPMILAPSSKRRLVKPALDVRDFLELLVKTPSSAW